MQRRLQLKSWSFFFAVTLTLAAGWAGLKHANVVLFYMGIVGAIPMIMIEGVHGGGTRAQDMAGGVVFVVVNVVFYYWILNWATAKLLKVNRAGKSDP